MTPEERDQMLYEVKTDVAVVATKVAHIEKLLETKTTDNRFLVGTLLSVTAVCISLGALLWT